MHWCWQCVFSVSYLVDAVTGRVDGAQLLQVISGVTQTSEGLKHLLHSRVGSLCGHLCGVSTAWNTQTHTFTHFLHDRQLCNLTRISECDITEANLCALLCSGQNVTLCHIKIQLLPRKAKQAQNLLHLCICMLRFPSVGDFLSWVCTETNYEGECLAAKGQELLYPTENLLSNEKLMFPPLKSAGEADTVCKTKPKWQNRR